MEPEESQSTACDKMQKSLELRENRTVALQPEQVGVGTSFVTSLSIVEMSGFYSVNFKASVNQHD